MSLMMLNDDHLRRAVPAAFARAPHEAVSDRYGFVPTIQVVHALRDEGWYPVRAQQTNCRDLERVDVAKHMIRFRQDPDRQMAVGDSVAELVLTNSHDRSSAYQLDLGLFRLICLNGMVTPVGETGGIRVRHGKNVVNEILEGSVALVDHVPTIQTAMEAFQSLSVDHDEAELFATAALELRYGDDWQRKAPIKPENLLEARRREDERDQSLWGVFNKTQENLLKGGIRGYTRSGRRTRTRAIHSVTEDVRLNRALWRLTERFAELKGVDLAA
ncbi:MAG: DUF932 domain-containing protein [Ectothiorhodospira sp.]